MITTNNDSGLNLDHLEALARSAVNERQSIADYKLANYDFRQAAGFMKPQALLELISLARRAAPVSAPIAGDAIKPWKDRVNLSDYIYTDQLRAAFNACESEIKDLRAALANQPAPTAAPEQPTEAFAWAAFAENGNVIIWSKNRAQVEPTAKQYGRPVVPVIALSALSQPSEAAPLADTIDTPEFQKILGLYVDGVAGQWELIAHINEKLAAPSLPSAPEPGDDLYLTCPFCDRRAGHQPALEQGSSAWIVDVVRDVAELPDRDSPPGREDMMLVTVNELIDIIERHAPAAPSQAAQHEASDEQARRERENAEFTEWWASSGQGADPAHTIITENACHATWQERARRVASPVVRAQSEESEKPRGTA